MTDQRRRVLVAVTVLLLVAPVALDRDSFPLSTYPMYASTRGDVVAVATANGITTSGDTERLSLALIGDIDDPLIVAALVRDAIRDGAGGAERLCRDIATRVRADSERFGQVEVVTERHDVVDHASGRESLESREVHAVCEVSP